MYGLFYAVNDTTAGHRTLYENSVGKFAFYVIVKYRADNACVRRGIPSQTFISSQAARDCVLR